MFILTIRTDKPEAEIGLYENGQQLAYKKWQAHRQLSETLHSQIAKILQSQGRDWSKIDGIVAFKGPGSFTGLRIGLSVANALAYGLGVPIVSTSGKNWIEQGLKLLQNGKNEEIALPEYGAEAKVTAPKK